MARIATVDQNVLEMAIAGYKSQMAKIEAAIADIHAQLGHHQPGHPKVSTDGAGQKAPGKRVISAAGRRRIALAQKKRWAAQRAGTAKAKRPKRKMSAAGRAAIIAATKKRWAAFHKAKKAAAKA